MQTSGRKFLKVCGILMMIIGVIGALVSIMGIIGYNHMAPTMVADMEKVMRVSINTLMTNMAIEAVKYIVLMVTGVLGVLFSKNRDKAKLCLILGVFVMLLQIASCIYIGARTGFDLGLVMSLIIGIVIPGLFTFGALKNMRA